MFSITVQSIFLNKVSPAGASVAKAEHPPVIRAKGSSTDHFISQSSGSSKLLQSLPSTWYLLQVLVQSKADNKWFLLLSILQSLCDVTSVRNL